MWVSSSYAESGRPMHKFTYLIPTDDLIQKYCEETVSLTDNHTDWTMMGEYLTECMATANDLEHHRTDCDLNMEDIDPAELRGRNEEDRVEAEAYLHLLDRLSVRLNEQQFWEMTKGGTLQFVGWVDGNLKLDVLQP